MRPILLQANGIWAGQLLTSGGGGGSAGAICGSCALLIAGCRAGPEGLEVLCVEFRCLYREDVCGVPEGAPSRRGARGAQNRRLPGVDPAHRVLWGFFLAKSKICCGGK